MYLKAHLDQLFDTEEVNYQYEFGDAYICKDTIIALRVMAEVCRFFAMNPDECINTGASLICDDENEIYKVIIRDI